MCPTLSVYFYFYFLSIFFFSFTYLFNQFVNFLYSIFFSQHLSNHVFLFLCFYLFYIILASFAFFFVFNQPSPSPFLLFIALTFPALFLSPFSLLQAIFDVFAKQYISFSLLYSIESLPASHPIPVFLIVYITSFTFFFYLYFLSLYFLFSSILYCCPYFIGSILSTHTFSFFLFS